MYLGFVNTFTSQQEGSWFESWLGNLCGVCMFSQEIPGVDVIITPKPETRTVLRRLRAAKIGGIY